MIWPRSYIIEETLFLDMFIKIGTTYVSTTTSSKSLLVNPIMLFSVGKHAQ